METFSAIFDCSRCFSSVVLYGDEKQQDNVVSYANPIFHGDEETVQIPEDAAPVERKRDIDSIDFEKKLEESLKNL